MKHFNKFVTIDYFIKNFNMLTKFGDISEKQLTNHIDSYYLSPELFEALRNNDIKKLGEEDFMTLLTMAHNYDNIICHKFEPDINDAIRLDDMIYYGTILINNDIVSEKILQKIAKTSNTNFDTLMFIIRDMQKIYYHAYDNNAQNMIDLKTMETIYNNTLKAICYHNLNNHDQLIKSNICK